MVPKPFPCYNMRGVRHFRMSVLHHRRTRRFLILLTQLKFYSIILLPATLRYLGKGVIFLRSMPSASGKRWHGNQGYQLDRFSKKLQALGLSFFMAAGILITLLVATAADDWQLSEGKLLVVLLAAAGIAIGGIVLAMKSPNPGLSLLGLVMVSTPFGMLSGVVRDGIAIKPLFISLLILVVLGIVGVMIPDDLRKWGSWLFGITLIVLLGLFVVPLAGFFGVPIEGAMTALDWVILVLFSGWLIHDWNQAMRLPATLDNCIDGALGIYIDWLNIWSAAKNITD